MQKQQYSNGSSQGQEHGLGFDRQREIPPPPSDQSQSQNYINSAIMLLDITTIQGLFLYTLYLLHRLRFFRWQDARKWTLLCQKLFWACLSPAHTSPTSLPSVVSAQKISISSAANEETGPTLSSSSSSNGQEVAAFPQRDEKRGFSINDRLPPEILILVFRKLNRPQTLRRCSLVCRSWYFLLGPRMWKTPRVLWSRHWSRFFPTPGITMTTTTTTTTTTTMTMTSTTATAPYFSAMTSSRHKIGKDGRDTISGNPFNDPITALASGQLDDLDRQELEQWLSWKKREKARHIQDLKRRRRLEQRQRLARGQNRTEGEITIDGLNSSSEDDHDDDEDDDHEDLQEEQRMDEESETETDYASDDESPLMRLVNAFDYLQSLVPRTRDSSTALNTDQHLEAVTPSPNKGYTFFSNSFADVRRRQATKECRQRLAKMQDYDGLPASLPLRTCGQWMQVINLQQETHFQQKNFSRTLTHHLPSITRSQEQQMESARQQQQTTSFFGTRSPFHIHHTTSESTYAGSEPIRLKSRRDFITDKTLQTILDHCPGLCRLTISECHGITDEGMRMIRDSACVSRQTLVSLHMAGCHQITDQGLFNLLGQDNNSNHHIRSVPRFESLDLAGCCQISDDSLIPLLEQCGQRLQQLRVSDCANVTSKSIEVLAQRCPAIQWLDLARSGKLTDHCLCMLAERCSDLEWLNLARCHPNETSCNKNLEDVDLTGSYDNAKTEIEGEDAATNEQDEFVQEAVADRSITMLCESCPKIQLLDLSYISTVSNAAIEALSETAHSLVCLTIIGCPGITSEALTSLARLRNKSGKLGCITMGDALGISESDIEQIMQGTLSGWQKSLVDETNIGEILGRSWDE